MRYFLFNYSWSQPGGKLGPPTKFGVGNIYVELQNFPSNSELRAACAKKLQQSYYEYADETWIVIIGWCEFSTEEDYRNFLG